MTEPAGIYCRLSLARFGDTTKVDEQARISRDLAEARGWTVADIPGYPDEKERGVWKDNSRSAWKRNRKRPGWDAMLAAVESGAIRNIVVYHGDRMVRQPYDLEVLLNLADQRGVTIASPTGTRSLDDSNDRFVLRILVAQACMESENTSRRKKTGYERMARDGIAPPPGGPGGRGFGYERDGRTPVPAEAEALRRAAQAILLEGATLAGLARAIGAAGLTATTGSPVTAKTLKAALTRPRTAGLLADGRPGSWQPVLDRETWEMTRAVLARRAAERGAAGTSRKYLLSGIAVCAVCGRGVQPYTPSRGKTRPQGLAYRCVTPGCRAVHRNMGHLDAYVSGRVVAYLDSEPVTAALAPAAGGTLAAEIAQLEARREETRDVIGELAAHPGVDLAQLARGLASFDTRIAELRATEHAGSGRARLLTAHAGITPEGFRALPLAARRALVTACYQVTLLPAGRGPGFRAGSVRMEPRGG